MAASLLFACGLNEKKLPSFVHISEESNIDGSFLISSILGQRLGTSNAGTLLVCLQQDYENYFHAGMRMGYNCNLFMGKTLSVIDSLNAIATNFKGSSWLQKEVCITDVLLEDIKERISSTLFTVRMHNTVLIDNLSILMNLGATQHDIQKFCNALANLSETHENLTIITKMNNCGVHYLVDNNVAKLASLIIRILKFKSGVFREVDGKLLIKKLLEDPDKIYEHNFSSREILYKVNDRNVKMFNPGEIGLKG